MTGGPNKRPAFEPASELLKPTGYNPQMKRPASTVAGALLVILRALASALWIGAVVLSWSDWMNDLDVFVDGVVDAPEAAAFSLTVVLVLIGAIALIDAVLAFFILGGRNWARIIVMAFAVVSISTSFLQWWVEGQEITIRTTLFSLGLDILILLALSSRSASAYARRNERRGGARDD